MAFNNCNNINIGQRGPKGDKGPKGPRGARGPMGDMGPIGPMGDKGDKGLKGDKGDKGPTGDMGQKGDKGPKGPKGDAGDTGAKGLRGDTGETGIPGIRGITGEAGDDGEKGPAGDRGGKGPKGEMGDVGEAGDIGPQGDAGERGFQGFAGFEGPKGDIGDAGPRGDAGPLGDQGERGIEGDTGPVGDSGKKTLAIPLPGEIIMKKVLRFIKEENFRCYVDLRTPVNTNIQGIGGINSLSFIDKLELDSVFFSEDIVVPIENINAVTVVHRSDNERNKILNKVFELFNKVMRCEKNAPAIVELDVNGEPVETGDLSIDYEYFVECTCNGVDGCSCIAKKIDICRYTGYEGEIINKRIEAANSEGKVINRIITKRGELFSDVPNKITPFELGPRCISSVIILYVTEDMNQGILEKKYIWSLVNLDKVSVIEFR